MSGFGPDSEKPTGVSRVTIAAGVLVVAGAVLAVTVDMVFLVLFGAGVFGPGALRELGILKDQDEFQREESRAAGYRAFVVAGLFLCIWLAVAQRGVVNLDSEMALSLSMILILLTVVWLLSTLFGYWGAKGAATRILLVFGAFWLGFILLSHLTEPTAMLMEALVAAPFFLLAWTAQRWPRVTGALLVAVGLFVFFAFDMYEAFRSRMDAFHVILTMFVPLMACGVGLLGVKPEESM